MSTKNTGYYFSATLQVIADEFKKAYPVFESNPDEFLKNPDTYLPTKARLNHLVADKKTKDSFITAPSSRYTANDVKVSVHLSLPALLDAGKILQVFDKCFVPNTNNGRMLALIPELMKIPFSRENIFFASPKLILVPISKISRKHLSTIKTIFRTFITDSLCYDIRITPNYVVLMIDGPETEISTIGQSLAAAIRYCYQRQQPPQNVLRKKGDRTYTPEYAWDESGDAKCNDASNDSAEPAEESVIHDTP